MILANWYKNKLTPLLVPPISLNCMYYYIVLYNYTMYYVICYILNMLYVIY